MCFVKYLTARDKAWDVMGWNIGDEPLLASQFASTRQLTDNSQYSEDGQHIPNQAATPKDLTSPNLPNFLSNDHSMIPSSTNQSALHETVPPYTNILHKNLEREPHSHTSLPDTTTVQTQPAKFPASSCSEPVLDYLLYKQDSSFLFFSIYEKIFHHRRLSVYTVRVKREPVTSSARTRKLSITRTSLYKKRSRERGTTRD
jgi:hypothetical protein